MMRIRLHNTAPLHISTIIDAANDPARCLFKLRTYFRFFTRSACIAYWRTESFCVIRQSGVNRKKAGEILTGNYRRCKIVAHCLMAQGASLRQYISAGSDVPSLVLTQRFINLDLKLSNDAANKITIKKRNAACNLSRFAYSSGHCLLILFYWGGNGNT